MTKLFISYSRKDADRVDPLIVRLQSAGYDVWLDTFELRGGEQWRRSIVEAVDNCDHFLIVLSSNSVISENVRKELDLAESAHKPVIPLEMEFTDIPPAMKYQLVGLQIVSFIKEPDVAFEKLLAALGDERVQAMGRKADGNGQVRVNPAFVRYDTDEAFNWRGHEIVIRGEVQAKYLWVASDTTVFVNGYQVAKAGGFTMRDVGEGTFMHLNQPQSLRFTSSQGEYRISLNGELIKHGRFVVRYKPLSFLATLALALIFSCCLWTLMN
jgi:hypothetical protein